MVGTNEEDFSDDALDLANSQQGDGGDGEEQHTNEGEPLEDAVIGFSDDDEGGDDDPLVKRLRNELRDRDRKIAQMSRTHRPANDSDPEPVVPPKKTISDFDYDPDKFGEYVDQREEAVTAHADWKAREGKRTADRERQQSETTKVIEQQKRSLGVSDYEERSAIVQERLTEAQIGILINGVENPARMIYALGRSPSRLDMIAGEDNLAKFAVMLGKLEKEIKVTKRTPPTPESRVRGATASVAQGGTDKELARLQKEAEKSGDSSKVIAYKRQLRAQQAA